MEDDELEDLMVLNGLRKSRRKIKEPGWMSDYVMGKKGKNRAHG